MPRPLAVALTGGIAAGKSEALAAFGRHGAATASSDEIVHRLYDDGEVRAAVRDRWGERVLAPDGGVDRRAVASIVFADAAELEWLESFLHPRVRAAYARWIEELRAQPGPPALAVIEIPLLYETGGETRFDRVVAVSAPAEVRAARRGGIDERERRLIPDEEKLERADFGYVNDGTLAELEEFVVAVVAELASAS